MGLKPHSETMEIMMDHGYPWLHLPGQNRPTATFFFAGPSGMVHLSSHLCTFGTCLSSCWACAVCWVYQESCFAPLSAYFHVVLIWNVGGHFDRPVEKYDGRSSNPNEHLGKSSQLHLLSHGIFSFESGFLDFWTI